jgi:hypothetical protein
LNNTSGENNELNDINQVLQSIGFIDPVTKETAGKDFIEQLAKQINEFFSVKFYCFTRIISKQQQKKVLVL